MKINLLVIILVTSLFSCESDARRFDISKELSFLFEFENDEITDFEEEKDLDFEDLASYQKCSEGYRINSLGLNYSPDITNQATTIS